MRATRCSPTRRRRSRGDRARAVGHRDRGARRRRPSTTSRSSGGWAAWSRSSSRPPRRRRPRPSTAPGPRGEVVPISTHDQLLGGRSGQVYLGCSFPARDAYRMTITEMGRPRRARAGLQGLRLALRRRLPGVPASSRRAVAGRRARDQPARGRHDAPVPRAALPDGGRTRQLDGALHLARRPHEVLSGHRQPARRPLSKHPARGPDRHRHGQQPALQPSHRVGRAVPPARRAVGVRQARA